MVGVPALERWVCGPSLAHRLADLVLAELADHRRADDEADAERGQHAENARSVRYRNTLKNVMSCASWSKR
jgi:hypothetical protein